jgi:hypothetical protein
MAELHILSPEGMPLIVRGLPDMPLAQTVTEVATPNGHSETTPPSDTVASIAVETARPTNEQQYGSTNQLPAILVFGGIAVAYAGIRIYDKYLPGIKRFAQRTKQQPK